MIVKLVWPVFIWAVKKRCNTIAPVSRFYPKKHNIIAFEEIALLRPYKKIKSIKKKKNPTNKLQKEQEDQTEIHNANMDKIRKKN